MAALNIAIAAGSMAGVAGGATADSTSGELLFTDGVSVTACAGSTIATVVREQMPAIISSLSVRSFMLALVSSTVLERDWTLEHGSNLLDLLANLLWSWQV